MQQPILKISLGQLQKNTQFFKEHTTAKLCGVVKADAYGHGATDIAQFLEPLVDYFAVATVQEGVQLRLAGIKKRILVFTPATCKLEVLEMLQYALIASITDKQDYILLQKILLQENRVLVAHIKVNTGMNRYGFNLPDFQEFCKGKLSDRIQIEGIYSHFYYVQQVDRTKGQFLKFMQFANRAEKVFGKLIKHIVATGGFFLDKEYHLDMVRIGLGLYGYLPNEQHIVEIQPIMQLCANVIADKKYCNGGAGYSIYRPKSKHIATIRLGYADGLYYQKTAKIPPCMDCQVVEGEYKKYQVIPNFLNFESYAKANNTIVYDVLTSFGNRIQREYLFDFFLD